MKAFLVSGLVAAFFMIFQPIVATQQTNICCNFAYKYAHHNSLPAKWLPYTSKKGKFTIEFPGKPAVLETALYGTEYGKIILYTASYEPDPNHSFNVSYCDYPKSFLRKSDPIELMENARLAALDNSDIQNDSVFTINGYSALRCVAYYPKSKSHMYYQIMLVKNRLYQILAGSLIDEEDNYDYLRFFNSFSLTK